MSIATRLGDWSGRWHVGEQAEAGGACSSEHCSCWSHAELNHPSCEVSIPGDPLVHPKQVVTWLLCANAAGRCHERLGGTSGNPPATATAIAALCIARAYIYPERSFFYFTEVVLSPTPADSAGGVGGGHQPRGGRLWGRRQAVGTRGFAWHIKFGMVRLLFLLLVSSAAGSTHANSDFGGFNHALLPPHAAHNLYQADPLASIHVGR